MSTTNNIQNYNNLIKGCLINNRLSQKELYCKLAPAMFVVALRYSANKEDAEESLQEGFVKIFEKMEQFRFEGPFEGWCRKIVVNCALQKLRNKPMLYALPHSNIDDIHIAIDETVSNNLDAKDLITMIQHLPPAYKMVFNLYVFENLKHKEIAELLNISEGTSKSNLSDARKLLQKMLNDINVIKLNKNIKYE